jgi:hypothetical protein
MFLSSTSSIVGLLRFCTDMVERLNNIAYAQCANEQQSNGLDQNFNPRSVSFDVHTREELAAVNEFLVTLGRDVSTGGYPRHHLNIPHHAISYSYPPEPYFDPVSLSQLGLAGMPGVLPLANYSNEQPFSTTDSTPQPYHSSRSSHSSVDSGHFGSLYPSINDQQPPVTYSPPHQEYVPSNLRRLSPRSGIPTPPNVPAGLPYPQQQQRSTHQQQHRPLETGSPNSSSLISTPETTTPPDSTSSFDYLRTSRGAPSIPHLGPVDYSGKSIRTIVPLKAAPGMRRSHTTDSRPSPIGSHLTLPPYHGPLTPSSSSPPPSPSQSLYPLLKSGDIQYKLPPLQKIYRSPSPTAMDESTASSTASSPVAKTTILPSLRSMSLAQPPPRRSESDDLAREVDRIGLENRTHEISPEMRRKHARLIRNLLVSINMDFKKKAAAASRA